MASVQTTEEARPGARDEVRALEREGYEPCVLSGDSLEATEAALSLAYRQLLSVEWPFPLISALNLYRQGIRQAEDAVEDFGTFMVNLDTDALVEGRSILRWAAEMLGEAREALGLV